MKQTQQIELTTDSAAVNWLIAKTKFVFTSTESGAYKFEGYVNGTMRGQVKAWFDGNNCRYSDGNMYSCRSLHINGYSLVLKAGSRMNTQDHLILWVEALSTDETQDQALVPNYWVC